MKLAMSKILMKAHRCFGGGVPRASQLRVKESPLLEITFRVSTLSPSRILGANDIAPSRTMDGFRNFGLH